MHMTSGELLREYGAVALENRLLQRRVAECESGIARQHALLPGDNSPDAPAQE